MRRLLPPGRVLVAALALAAITTLSTGGARALAATPSLAGGWTVTVVGQPAGETWRVTATGAGPGATETLSGTVAEHGVTVGTLTATRAGTVVTGILKEMTGAGQGLSQPTIVFTWTATESADGDALYGTRTVADGPGVSFVAVRQGTSGARRAADLGGTWHCCGAGGAGAQEFVIHATGGTGDQPDGAPFATLSVSTAGDAVIVVTTYTTLDPGYVATFTGVLSANGRTMTGTWTSNTGQSGTWTATRSRSASSRPARDPLVAPIAGAIGTPRQIFASPGHDLANAVITVAVILFITFPANVFNQTLSANYAEILTLLAGARRRLRRRTRRREDESAVAPAGPASPDAGGAAGTPSPGRIGPRGFGAVLLAGAVLGGLLNPAFGVNRTSAAGLVATVLAFAFGAGVSWLVAHLFRRAHHYATRTYLRALPLGLGVAVLCVLVSRLSHFEPGYLYGVVVSLAFLETLPDRHNAHLTAISTVSTLAIALLAWFIWLPVNHLALRHAGNVLVATTDDALGSIFIGGLVGTVIGLLPLEFMPGGTIAKWRRDVWAVVFFVALFLLVEVELRPAAGPTHPGGAPAVTAIVLFVVFGGLSFGTRQFFAHRVGARERVPADAAGPPAQE